MRLAAAATIFWTALAVGQLPPDQSLRPADRRRFEAEIERLKRLRKTAADPFTVDYALARTWVAGGRYGKAYAALRKLAARRVGIDPANDDIFAKLGPAREYGRLLDRVRRDTPPLGRAQAAFSIRDATLFPEGIAFDPLRNRLFIGSSAEPRILVCSLDGACRPFLDRPPAGLGGFLGLKADPRDGSLWAAFNSDRESSLQRFSPEGRLLARYAARESGPHLFNDLAVAATGEVYLTDTRAGAVYWLAPSAAGLEVLIPGLAITAPNGIALADGDAPLLYVAGFPDGLTLIDLRTRAVRALPRPRGLCLGTIDGLVFAGGSLYAVQNGAMAPRIVRLVLTPARQRIVRMDILERRHPLFDEPTTAALAGRDLYFIANPQLGKPADTVKPFTVLRQDSGLR